MRVLIINKFLYPNGGSETYIFKLGEALEQHGHEVQYFGMEHEGRCVGNRVNAYTSGILFRTLLNRNLWLNPLSNVMGGWGIWETMNGEQKLTTECIENVIMMVPFTSMVIWTFQEKVGSSWKKILWYSGKIAFIFSISIEVLQLFLRLGTFQLSDLFYNTVGGVVGGLVYYGIVKARKHL